MSKSTGNDGENKDPEMLDPLQQNNAGNVKVAASRSPDQHIQVPMILQSYYTGSVLQASETAVKSESKPANYSSDCSSSQQLNELEYLSHRYSHYPDDVFKHEMSRRLGLSEFEVQEWLHDRRMKGRKHERSEKGGRIEPDQSPSHSTKFEVDDSSHDLSERLKKLYTQSTLPQIPWMNKGGHLWLWLYYTDLKLDSENKQIELKDIFAPIKSVESNEFEPPKRIFIEGEPGCGKTTLMAKLAYNWSVGYEYMQRFKFLFVVQLRRTQDVESGLQQEAEKCGFEQMEKLAELIVANGTDLLILLDGYDEIPTGSPRESINTVLYKLDYSEATIILTCRSGKFDCNNKEFQNLPNSSCQKREIWDRKVSVCGLDNLGQREMLTRFLTTDKGLVLFRKFKDLTKPESDILKSPLILMLLVFSYSNDKINPFDVKSTNLFKDIINGLVNYNVRKKDESIDWNIDLFGNQQEIPQSLIEDFTEFGKICLDYLEESKLEFENSELMERIYSFGFLKKIESISSFETETFFVPIHRSFVECFAALSIRNEFYTSGEHLLEEKTILSLNRIFCNTQGTSLVLPILVGMLKTEAHYFFDQLAPHAHLYTNFQTGLWKMLEECEESDLLIESLKCFIPKDMDSSIKKKFATSSFFTRLIHKANEYSKLQKSEEVLTDKQYDVFISYCQADGSDLACQLKERLNVKGFVTYIDETSLGKEHNPQQDHAAENSKCMIFIISPESVKSNDKLPIGLALKMLSSRIIPIYYKRSEWSQELPAILKGITGIHWDGRIGPQLLDRIEAAVRRSLDFTDKGGDKKSDELTNTELWDISEILQNRQWRNLGEQLRLNVQQLKEIQELNSTKDLRECTYAMLLACKEVAPSELNYNNLHRDLLELGLKCEAHDLQVWFDSPLKKLKSKLQEVYTDIAMPFDSISLLLESYGGFGKEFSVPGYYVDSQMSVEENGKILAVKLEELFDSAPTEEPTGLLIKGDPGCGKTSLALKLASDWARGEPYMRPFELLFYIPCQMFLLMS